MPGTKAGSLKAKATILARNPDFYKEIGAMGGKKSRGGGFASDKELAKRAGRLGGLKSRRGKAKAKEV